MYLTRYKGLTKKLSYIILAATLTPHTLLKAQYTSWNRLNSTHKAECGHKKLKSFLNELELSKVDTLFVEKNRNGDFERLLQSIRNLELVK